MNLKQRDLILIDYPFSNLENKKVRPALIISNDFYNSKSEDCVLAPLTSVIKEEDFSIIIEQKNLSFGKLIRQSRIKTDKIFCANKKIIIKKIGTINENLFEVVKREIISLF